MKGDPGKYCLGNVLPFGWDDSNGKPFNPYDESKKTYGLPNAIDVMLP